MNLNSYIGLMGGSYRDGRPRPGGARPGRGRRRPTRRSRTPDYVLTLDADSVLLPEYCLRLVYLLEQTREPPTSRSPRRPYSAFPGAAHAARAASPAPPPTCSTSSTRA